MAKLTRRERRLLKRSGGEQRSSDREQPIIPIKSDEKRENKKDSAPTHRHYNNWFSNFYDRNLKRLEIISISLIIFSLIVIGHQVATTGSFIGKDVSLTGGQIITITEPGLNAEVIEPALRGEFPKANINVRGLSEYGTAKGVIIETSPDANLDDVLKAMETYVPDVQQKFSVETTGSNLGAGFFQQVILALILAFIFMSIVVFILFKTFAPSMAVIVCAASDMLFTVAMIDLFGIKVSTAGIAALLMLIGYSVDTDILLTTRLLKAGKGDYLDRTMSSMKTGLTMTIAAMSVVIVGLLVSQSEVLKQIFTILLFGLIADIIYTYIQNASILWTYMERKGLKKKGN